MPVKLPLKMTYVEFTSPRLEQTQAFLADAFGWSYVDYGDDYKDVQGSGIGGGLERGELRPPLVVLQTDDLEGALRAVIDAGGTITQPIFGFPGGRRFQFTEPGGNELAVFSES
ncbi:MULTISPECIES: VOC family protein [unclassified Roseitalea]|uniref:VOC family protein n=1 Tax=unclassified Roseitalea TaxID=2639107 RepID=UPI00273DB068|nr:MULTISPECIES: VOC family protein [unclassified Roseitalea]